MFTEGTVKARASAGSRRRLDVEIESRLHTTRGQLCIGSAHRAPSSNEGPAALRTRIRPIRPLQQLPTHLFEQQSLNTARSRLYKLVPLSTFRCRELSRTTHDTRPTLDRFVMRAAARKVATGTHSRPLQQSECTHSWVVPQVTRYHVIPAFPTPADPTTQTNSRIGTDGLAPGLPHSRRPPPP